MVFNSKTPLGGKCACIRRENNKATLTQLQLTPRPESHNMHRGFVQANHRKAHPRVCQGSHLEKIMGLVNKPHASQHDTLL